MKTVANYYHKLNLNWNPKYVLVAALVVCLVGFSSAASTWQHIHPDRQSMLLWWAYVAIVIFGYLLWVLFALLADVARVLVPVINTANNESDASFVPAAIRRHYLLSHLTFAVVIGITHLAIDTATLWWLFSGEFNYLEALGKKLLRWLPIEILAWWCAVGLFTLLAVRSLTKQNKTSAVENTPLSIQRLCYQRDGETHYLDVENLVFLESCDNYAIAKSSEDKQLISESLKSLEQRLDQNRFFRVHRSYLVNMAKVVAWQKGESGMQLRLSSGDWIPVSRRKSSQVLKFCQKQIGHLAMPS